jgi:hypothetical protein
MLKLLNRNDYSGHEAITAVTAQIRVAFRDIFSAWYTKQLAPALTKVLNSDEYKEAEDLKRCDDPVVRGFSDLLAKKKFFPEPLSFYRQEEEIKKVFEGIYQGAGFDDEAAFILAFHDFVPTSEIDARTHYQKIKARLSPDDQLEIEAYLDIIENVERKLLEVNFLVLVDEEKQIKGFSLFHIFQEQDNSTILHVRQAAMLHQNRGYASIMACYYADHFPSAIYEANQRKANNVAMKNKLITENLLLSTPAVMGYNQEYYVGLRGKDTVLKSFLKHQAIKHTKRLFFSKSGKYYDTESIKPFFSQVRLHKDVFTLQDDNFLNDNLVHLHKPKAL